MKTLSAFVLYLMFLGSHLNAQNFDHAIFDELLQLHVKNGLLDYQSLKVNQVKLTEYVKQLEQVDPDQFDQWSKQAPRIGTGKNRLQPELTAEPSLLLCRAMVAQILSGKLMIIERG